MLKLIHILIACLLATTCAVAADKPLQDDVDGVIVISDGTPIEGIRELINLCQYALTAQLGRSKAVLREEPVRVVIGDMTGTKPPSRLTAVLPADVSILKAAHDISRCLMLQRLRREAPDGKALNPAHFEWLVGAVVFSVLQSQPSDRFVEVPDYSAAHALLMSGATTDPAKLVTLPMNSDWPLAYELYAMHCHLLLRVLKHTFLPSGTSASQAVYEALLTGSGPDTALRQALAPRLDRGRETLEEWFAGQAAKFARQSRDLTAPEALIKHLHEIRSVTVLMPGADGHFRPRQIPLDQARDYLADYEYDPDMLEGKERELFALIRDAPSYLHPSLALYMEAIQEFRRSGNQKELQEKLTKAGQHLEAAIASRQRLCDYLDQLGRNITPANQRFARYLYAIGEKDKALRSLDPQLHEYLDSLEK
jgi:hypothetical protein